MYSDDRAVVEQLSMRKALERNGTDRLYQHQADAVSIASAGENVVLQAPTASGKTLAFQIPMLESLLTPNSHALMIYPTKALVNARRASSSS